MRYKLITFDFTNTLMQFRLPPGEQYLKVAALNGIEIKDKKKFQSQFKNAFKIMNAKHPNFGNSADSKKMIHWYVRNIKHNITYLHSSRADFY